MKLWRNQRRNYFKTSKR